MTLQSSRTLAEYFKQRVGDSLRFVGHYTDDSTDIVYIRGDLDETRSEEANQQLFDLYRRGRECAVTQEAILDAGVHHCTLRVFDGALVFNFAQGDDIGTIISFDPEAGQDLLSFITQCLGELQRDSPQEVNAPDWVRT